MKKKKKVIVKVHVNCSKCRRKAMDVAAKHGAQSVAVAGEQEDLLVVEGDDVDPADLAVELRKKLGHAKILSVVEVALAAPDQAPGRSAAENGGGNNIKNKVQSTAPPPPPPPPPACCHYCCYHHPPPQSGPPSVVVVHEGYDYPPSCSVV